MSKITDKPYMEACSNGDGTYSAVKAAQWIIEAVTGKPLPEAEAQALVEEAKRRAVDRKPKA